MTDKYKRNHMILPVQASPYYDGSAVDAIKSIHNTLSTIARFHNMSVDEVVSAAQNASDPVEYQKRVLRLVERLNRLEGKSND